MSRVPISRALISVYDKAGLEDLASGLHAAGAEIVSTGSTAARIAAAGVPVTPVEQLTGFPECLDGRVKTLHPRVHAGLLADTTEPRHEAELAGLGIEPFQLLALSVVRSALQDAGYIDRPFPRDRTSVILGAGGGGADLTAGYMFRSSLPSFFGAGAGAVAEGLGSRLPTWSEDSFPGLLMNVAAGLPDAHQFGEPVGALADPLAHGWGHVVVAARGHQRLDGEVAAGVPGPRQRAPDSPA